MFRIECFCEDKHLAQIMHALAGLAKNLVVLPVANARPAKNGKIEAEIPGGMIGLIHKKVKAHDDFARPDVVAILRKAGRSPSAAGHYLRDMLKHDMIEKMPGTKGPHTRYRAK